jgi:hypothetical protein
MNKRLLTVTAAVFALAAAGVVAVQAQPAAPAAPPAPPHVERHMRFGPIDANTDGFVTRAEIQAQTERMFDEMDTNDDGKLDSTDRAARIERRVERRVIRKDGKETVEEDVTIEHGGPVNGERRIIVHKSDHKGGPRHHRGGRGHHMMGGPMPFMMFMHGGGEADVNNDGALSKQEMVNQHLRFFDAADVNGDGRIKFEPPPAPPAPPVPPTPPAAPTPPTPPAPPR